MERDETTRTLHEKILRPAVKDDIVGSKKKERGEQKGRYFLKKSAGMS